MYKTILAVDDSASIRMMLSFTLKENGYRVIEAKDGMDGLEYVVLLGRGIGRMLDLNRHLHLIPTKPGLPRSGPR